MISFSELYNENPSKVKNFFVMLENISNDINIVNLNFLNLVDKNGNSILHTLVQNKDFHTIKTLFILIKKIDIVNKSKFINLQNYEGNTALHLAAHACENSASDNVKLCESIARLLEEEGANKNIKNNKGLSIESTPEPVSTVSEYKQKIISSHIPLNNHSKNSSSSHSNNYLNNMATDISIDNYPPKVKDKVTLSDITSDVSVEQKKNPVNTSSDSVSSILASSSSNSDSKTSTDASKSVSTDASKSVSTDASKSVSIDASKSVSTDASKSASTDVSKSASTDVSKSASPDVSKSISTNASKNITESSTYSSTNSSSDKASNPIKGGMYGGNNSENSGLSDTSAFVKTLLTQFNSMKGGSRPTRGERILPSLSDYEAPEIYGGKDYGLSREQMKESSNIHDQVVKIFMDSGKSEEEARVMKMALYKYTKEKNSELNNLDRARKMLEYAEDGSVLKKLDLESSRKIYDEVKKSKKLMTESSEKPTEETTEVETEDKPKKKTTKKEPKKVSKKTKK
jgi:hypothetical protein